MHWGLPVKLLPSKNHTEHCAFIRKAHQHFILGKYLKISSTHHSGTNLEFKVGQSKQRESPYPSELCSVVVPINQIMQDFQHQLPELRVFHEGRRQQRVQKRGRKRIRDRCCFVSRSHLFIIGSKISVSLWHFKNDLQMSLDF